MARDFTSKEDGILADALQDGTMPVSPKIEAMRDLMRDEYNRYYDGYTSGRFHHMS